MFFPDLPAGGGYSIEVTAPGLYPVTLADLRVGTTRDSGGVAAITASGGGHIRVVNVEVALEAGVGIALEVLGSAALAVAFPVGAVAQPERTPEQPAS